MSISAPTDIADCQVWVKDDAGVYSDAGITPASDGDAVQQWNDQTGNLNHIIQLTSGNRMKYDGTHGLVVSEARSGVNQFMNLPTLFPIDRESFTIFFIVEFASLMTGLHAYNGFMACSTVTGFIDAGGANGTPGKPDTFLPSVDGPIMFTQRMFFCLTMSAGAQTWYVNGTTTTGAGIGSGSTTGGTIFGTGTYPMNGGIKQAGMYSRALSSGEVGDLYIYSQGLGVLASADINIVIAGDSLTEGQGATLNRNWARQMGYTDKFIRNAGRSSITLQGILADAATLLYPMKIAGKTNVLFIAAARNDLAGGTRTKEEAYGDLQDIVDGGRSAGFDKIIAQTVLPSSGLNGTTRADYNQMIRDGMGVDLDIDAIADAGADATIGVEGAQFDTELYPDNIHGNNITYGIEAGINKAAIDSVLGPTAPTVTARTITSDGTQLYRDYSELVTVNRNGYTFSGGHTLGTPTPALDTSPNTQWIQTITPSVFKAETITESFSGEGTVDADALELQNYTAQSVTNGSDVICAIPTMFFAFGGDTTITLTWHPNTESVFASVKIYTSATSGGTYTLVTTVNAGDTNYTHTGRTNGVAGFYKITSVDSGGNESAKSSFVSATPAVAVALPVMPITHKLALIG